MSARSNATDLANNNEALESLLGWWCSVPAYRRPGHDARFHLTPSESELYILDLREKWSRCGPGIMRLCEPYRDWIERDARECIQDVLLWLEVARSAGACASGSQRKKLSEWVEGWRHRLTALAEQPLAEAPGATLGIGLGSTLLASYRWWGDQCGVAGGPGGPLSDVPESVWPVVASVEPRFPVSVTELHFAIGKNPWTAAHVLNWLLSDKGILVSSKRAPLFAGPSAVPNARPWLDQLAWVFNDWHVSKFADRPRVDLHYNKGQLELGRSWTSGPEMLAAFSQIGNPIVPSAYVVPLHCAPLRVSEDGKSPLGAVEGQCTVFEFLISRLEQLSVPEFGRDEEISGPPLLYVVDGKRRNTLGLRIGSSSTVIPFPKGAADVLYLLGRDGKCGRTLAENIREIRHMRKLEAYVEPGKQLGNYYVGCVAPKLRGQVIWKARLAPPATI